MVTLTIDGKSVEVPEGTTVLNAARQADIEIPTLCDHPELTPYGGCRLCLVEIDGFRTLQTSCTIPASQNMNVRTQTDKVNAARKFVLTLIFSERNHFCPYCQVSGGDCELQNSAYAQGMTHWPLQPNWTPFAVDASHPYFVLDHNRCILCRRCVRACGELVGNYTLGFEERGAQSRLMADLGVPLGESTCVSCGVCLQVCPTGALIDRWSAYRGHETDIEKHETLCAECSVGCSVNVFTRDNNMVRIEGAWDGAANQGVLCEDGRFKPMDEKRQRIVTPLVRKDGVLKAATWEDALQTVVEKLRPIAGLNGKGIAALASTRLSAEALYQFKQLFGAGLATSTEEGASTSRAAELADARGNAFETNLDALENADVVLTIGADLTRTHQVLGFFVKRRLQDGLQLIVVDGQPNGLDTWANVTLKPNGGTNLDVLRAIASAVVGQAESLAQLAAKTGMGVEQIQVTADLLQTGKNVVLVFGKDLVEKDLHSLAALVELAEMTGARTLGTKSGANSLAASQYHLDRPFALNGQQAAYLAMGDEEPTERLIQRLAAIPFKVVQASYASKLTGMADVVLPVENWLEQDGHFINIDGRVQAAQAALRAPEDVRSSAEVLKELAIRLGVQTDERWMEALCDRPSTVAIATAA